MKEKHRNSDGYSLFNILVNFLIPLSSKSKFFFVSKFNLTRGSVLEIRKLNRQSSKTTDRPSK